MTKFATHRLLAIACLLSLGNSACGDVDDASESMELTAKRQELTVTSALTATFKTMFTGPNSCMGVVLNGQNRVAMAACAQDTRGSGQAWTIAPSQAAGSYTLSTGAGGVVRCLDIVNDGINDRVTLASCEYVSGQLWQIQDTEHAGYVRLTTQFTGTGRCLDIVNDGVNSELRMATCGNFSGQNWKVEGEKPTTPGATICKSSGCSGQLCVAEGQERETTCEFRPEYACYRGASCAVQPSGGCGWTPTSALTACLQSAQSSAGAGSQSSSGSGSSSPTTPGFTSTEERSVSLGSPIPEGWVIVRPNGANMILIMNLNGSNFGREQTVTLGSPIPSGWVIVRPNGANANLIKNLNGASSGTEQSVALGSPIPVGWVIVRPNGANANLIRKT